MVATLKAVLDQIFSGIIWHMQQEQKSTRLHDFIEGPTEDSILYTITTLIVFRRSLNCIVQYDENI